MEQPVKQTVTLFSLAKMLGFSGGRRESDFFFKKRKNEKKSEEGKENKRSCFSGSGIQCGGGEPRALHRASTSTCHLCLDTPRRT